MKNGFAGKVAIVTGAGSGIGEATAKLLARRGATVYVVDLDGPAAVAVAAEIVGTGGSATARAVDVTDADAVLALADDVFAAHGRVDVLHNNAGLAQAGISEQVPLDLWRRLVDVNVMGVVHGIHAFGPRMLEQAGGGHIVNTASSVGLVPTPLMLPYTTTKHAVVGLSLALNAEWSPRGVHVTALCPGLINTPITSKVTLVGLEGERDRIAGLYRRFGATPEDVAKAVVDSIRRRSLIRTVPRAHVVPVWLVHRMSPRAAQPLERLSSRILSGRRGARS